MEQIPTTMFFCGRGFTQGNGVTLLVDEIEDQGREAEVLPTGVAPNFYRDPETGDLTIETARQTIVAPRIGVQGPVFVKNK
jgi:hypothetical protein